MSWLQRNVAAIVSVLVLACAVDTVALVHLEVKARGDGVAQLRKEEHQREALADKLAAKGRQQGINILHNFDCTYGHALRALILTDIETRSDKAAVAQDKELLKELKPFIPGVPC